MLNSGHQISVGAGVGLLSRNIKVIGKDYADMYDDSFGARILVGLVTYNGRTYGGGISSMVLNLLKALNFTVYLLHAIHCLHYFN